MQYLVVACLLVISGWIVGNTFKKMFRAVRRVGSNRADKHSRLRHLEDRMDTVFEHVENLHNSIYSLESSDDEHEKAINHMVEMLHGHCEAHCGEQVKLPPGRNTVRKLDTED
jgi:hypothetical protein